MDNINVELSQRCTVFRRIYCEPAEDFRRQNSDINQVPNWVPTNIRRATGRLEFVHPWTKCLFILITSTPMIIWFHYSS